MLIRVVFSNAKDILSLQCSFIDNSSRCKLQLKPVSAPFPNMRTLKFKPQPTNEFFATVNQMFGASSQLPTTAEYSYVYILVLFDRKVVSQ